MGHLDLFKNYSWWIGIFETIKLYANDLYQEQLLEEFFTKYIYLLLENMLSWKLFLIDKNS